MLIEELEKNPQLLQMGEIELHRCRKRMSTTTISSYLQGRLFTFKNVHYEPAGMNTDANKERRRQFVLQISQYMQQNKRILWMDETNLNLFCRRTKGRSTQGTRCTVIQPNSRGPNVHIIGAISSFQVTLFIINFPKKDQ